MGLLTLTAYVNLAPNTCADRWGCLQEKCIFDTSEADAKAAVAAAEEAKRNKSLTLLGRVLSGCVIGAGWDEDESMHGVHGGRLYWDTCCEPDCERSFAGMVIAEPTRSGGAILGDTIAQVCAASVLLACQRLQFSKSGLS